MKPLRGPFADSRLSSTLKAFLAAKLAEIESIAGKGVTEDKEGTEEHSLSTPRSTKKFGSVRDRYQPNKPNRATEEASKKQNTPVETEVEEESEGPIKSQVPSQRLELFLSSSRKPATKKQKDGKSKKHKSTKLLQFLAAVEKKEPETSEKIEHQSATLTSPLKAGSVQSGKEIEKKDVSKTSTPKRPLMKMNVKPQSSWIKIRDPVLEERVKEPTTATEEIKDEEEEEEEEEDVEVEEVSIDEIEEEGKKIEEKEATNKLAETTVVAPPSVRKEKRKSKQSINMQRISRERSKLSRKSKLRVQATNKKAAKLSIIKDANEEVPDSDFKELANRFVDVFETSPASSEFPYIHEAGFLVWRVCETDSGFEVFPLSKQDVGIFFQADCFIAVNTKVAKSGEQSHDVHLWCGLNTNPACETAALRSLVELYGVLQGAAVLHRETEFNESQMFQSYFSHCGITHMDGDWASAFTNSNSYNRDLYKRMFAFKQNPKCLHLYEVECSLDSFDESRSYLLDFGYTLYYCFGEDVTPRSQYTAKVAITRIAEEHGVGANVSRIPVHEFRDLVTTNNTVFGVRDDTEELLQSSVRSRDSESCKLFKVSGNNKSYSFDRVPPSGPKFDLFELNEGDLYVIQTNVDVITWVGRKADKLRVDSPFSLAEAFCHEHSLPENTACILLQQDLNDSMLRGLVEKIV